MHNPYATTKAGQAATGTTSFAQPEDARLRDYDDAIGPRSEYYRPLFEQYDARGAGLSWHWPAFFATSAWFVYRKLYLPGILNFFWPSILTLVIGLLISTRVLSPGVGGSLILLLGPLPWIVLTLTANRIYWRRVKGLIGETPAYDDPVRRTRELERIGGVAQGPMAAMVVFTVLYGVGSMGVLAAVAIPAYQDYTLRAQVAEGYTIGSSYMDSVTDFRERTGGWPRTFDMIDRSPQTGRFISSLRLEQGSIVIVYGGKANRKLQGRVLILHPGIDAGRKVHWACGNRRPAEVVEWAPGPSGADLEARYLPLRCRPE